MKIVVEDEELIPVRTHPLDAGLDLKTKYNEIIEPGEICTIHTGVRVAIPEHMVGLLFVRSSIGAKGLMLANGVGVIDCGYIGEIMLKLVNVSDETIAIPKYDRVGQLVITPILLPELEFVYSLEVTDRGEGGFGSTNDSMART